MCLGDMVRDYTNTKPNVVPLPIGEQAPVPTWYSVRHLAQLGKAIHITTNRGDKFRLELAPMKSRRGRRQLIGIQPISFHQYIDGYPVLDEEHAATKERFQILEPAIAARHRLTLVTGSCSVEYVVRSIYLRACSS